MVHAEDPVGHAKHHADFYSKHKIPGSSLSCCNNQDCRPVKYRHTSKGIEVYLKKLDRWITPPKERVKVMRTPDDGGHWCGLERGLGDSGIPHTYCTFVPIPSI